MWDDIQKAQQAVCQELIDWRPRGSWDRPDLVVAKKVCQARLEEYRSRMREVMGEAPLSERLTPEELHLRAELFAHRASHRRWNSGYEQLPFRARPNSCAGQVFIDKYTVYMRMARHGAVPVAEEEAALAAAIKCLRDGPDCLREQRAAANVAAEAELLKSSDA